MIAHGWLSVEVALHCKVQGLRGVNGGGRFGLRSDMQIR